MVNISSKPVYYFYLIYVTFALLAADDYKPNKNGKTIKMCIAFSTFSDSLKNICSPPVIKFFSTEGF